MSTEGKDIKSVQDWLVDKEFNILSIFGNQGLFEDFICRVQTNALHWASSVAGSCQGDMGGIIAEKKIKDKIESIAIDNTKAKFKRGETSYF